MNPQKMTEIIKFPLYARLSFVLISLCLILWLIYIGQDILIPLLLSFLFAILLRPVVVFLHKKFRFPYVIAVVTAVVSSLLIVIGVITFVWLQVGDMARDWDKITQNFTIISRNGSNKRLISVTANRTNISGKRKKSRSTEKHSLKLPFSHLPT